MAMEKCNGCEEEFEICDMIEYQEHSEIYYCHECARDLEEECPCCLGRGCNVCLMLEF